MVQEAGPRTVSKAILLVARLVLFALPGILAWLVIRPNLSPKYLPIAAGICVALSALSLGLGAVLGVIVPRSGWWSEERVKRHKTDHRNGDLS